MRHITDCEGIGNTGSAGAPRAFDEFVVRRLVLEQQHELVIFEARAETDTARAHVHVHRRAAALPRRDARAARARDDEAALRGVEYRVPVSLVEQRSVSETRAHPRRGIEQQHMVTRRIVARSPLQLSDRQQETRQTERRRDSPCGNRASDGANHAGVT